MIRLFDLSQPVFDHCPNNIRTHEILLGAGGWIVEDLRFPEGWSHQTLAPHQIAR